MLRTSNQSLASEYIEGQKGKLVYLKHQVISYFHYVTDILPVVDETTGNSRITQSSASCSVRTSGRFWFAYHVTSSHFFLVAASKMAGRSLIPVMWL